MRQVRWVSTAWGINVNVCLQSLINPVYPGCITQVCENDRIEAVNYYGLPKSLQQDTAVIQPPPRYTTVAQTVPIPANLVNLGVAVVRPFVPHELQNRPRNAKRFQLLGLLRRRSVSSSLALPAQEC